MSLLEDVDGDLDEQEAILWMNVYNDAKGAGHDELAASQHADRAVYGKVQPHNRAKRKKGE